MSSSLPSRRRRALLLGSASAVAAGALAACGGGDDEPEPGHADSPELRRMADEHVRAGLVAVVLGDVADQRSRIAAAGLRRLGGNERVRTDDLFLIGSTTKAMTALVAARLVERGVIDWTTTLAQGLPDLATGMASSYRDITLEHLLAHRGGLMAFNNSSDVASFASYLSNEAAELPTTLAARQRTFAAWLLAQPAPDAVTPGRDFLYSNAGYALAGLMLEERSASAFPALVERELNQPLGVGLRWLPADEDAKDRPSGHAGQPGRLVVLPPEDAALARWVEVLRPAGIGAAVTPDGYARWLRWHLLALQSRQTPLPRSYVQRLRGLATGDYALGWGGARVDGRPVLAHDGAYLGFSSLATVDVGRNHALFAFTNTGGEDDAWWALQRLHAALANIDARRPQRSAAGTASS